MVCKNPQGGEHIPLAHGLIRYPFYFKKSQSFLLNELAEHLIIKGKNTFACLYECLHSKICKNTLYYMRFFEILHKELNTQKFMNLFPMWSFCNSSRCARTISHKDRNMHKHTHAQTHTYKCTLTQTHTHTYPM